MMANIIYDKTEKGQDEILTRKNHLASRMRSLLVMVDGKTDHDALLKKVAGLGLTEDSIAELLQQGFIAPHAAQNDTANAGSSSNTQQDVPAEKPAITLAEGESLYQALYNFYTAAIKSTLGLRGYAMQLKVERCANIDDFKALRQPFVDAVLKSKGPAMAQSLADHLDQLLALA